MSMPSFQRQRLDSSKSSHYAFSIDDSSSEEDYDHEQITTNASSLDVLLELSYSGETYQANQGGAVLIEDEYTPFDTDVPLHVDTTEYPPDAILKRLAQQGNDDTKTPKSGNLDNKFDSVAVCSYYETEMKAIDEFLKSHHETRIGINDDGERIIAPDVSMDLDDYVHYMEINAACPNAIRQTFLYCLRNNDLNMCDRILRDIGIEYILRHCLMYDGSFTTRSDSHSHDSEPITRTSCANMFWLAAFYGSADVLEMLIEECWIYFVEQETGGVIEPPKEVEQRADDNICLLLNNDVSVYKCTPLFIAATQNHADVIRVLHKYKVDLNETNGNGTTAAISAASRDNFEALFALGECDEIDFNRVNLFGVSPLLAACQFGAINAVRFLTHFNVDQDETTSIVNCRCVDINGFGCTAIAAKYNRKEVVEYLCQIHNPDNDRGVDINQRAGEQKNTALHIAVRYECKETISTFLQMIPRDIDPALRNSSGMTPLHIAASAGYTDIVKAFVVALKDQIKDLDNVDNRGMTPLFYASSRGHKEIVTLLAPQSDVNRQCNVVAIKKQNRNRQGEDHEFDTVQEDFESDTNTDAANVTDDNISSSNHKRKITVQMSALVAAITKNHVDVIYTLLYCGADPNQTDHKGLTAVSHAAKYGHLEIVEILVTQGADVKIRSKGGRLPIHKAKRNKHFHVVEYLETYAS